MKKIKVFFLALTSVFFSFSQTDSILIDVSQQKVLSYISNLDRSKFFNIHQSYNAERNDITLDQAKYLIDTLHVNFGRNIGATSYFQKDSLLKEDANRPGYPDLSLMQARGTVAKNAYKNGTWTPTFGTDEMVYVAQTKPIFPNNKYFNDPAIKGYKPKHTMGSAQFLKYFFKNYLPDSLQPKYFEVANECLTQSWELGVAVKDLIKFHTTVYDSLHAAFPKMKIGGHTDAWPEYDYKNFSNWKMYTKQFMDSAGQKMDFFSTHLYSTEGSTLRYGSRFEAIFDLQETYSNIKFGKVKPIMISEHGGIPANAGDSMPFDPKNYWWQLKNYNHNIFSLMERENKLLKSIPFICGTETWQKNYKTNPNKYALYYFNSQSQSWQLTPLIKFYQLWANVKGKRVYSRTTNADISSQCFVDGNKVYVCLNNMDTVTKSSKINLSNIGKNNKVISVFIKRLYLGTNKIPKLDSVTYATNLQSSVVLRPEETIIFEITLQSVPVVEKRITYKTYYNKICFQPIKANTVQVYTFGKIDTVGAQEVVLRLGFGRQDSITVLSKKPIVRVNGVLVQVPTNWSGLVKQSPDKRFFGVLEIRVPAKIMKPNGTTVHVVFPDQGGYVSSVIFKVGNVEKIKSMRIADETLMSYNSNELKVYPNPASEYISFEVPDCCQSPEKGIVVSIYDVLGKLVCSSERNSDVENATEKIDLSGLKSGVYLIAVVNREKTYMRKFIKN